MYDFKFADIGEGIHEGQVLKWLLNEGDKVKEGETLVIIETDKVNAEIPSPVDGILTKQGAKVGETIHVGETLALINDGSSSSNIEDKNDVKVVAIEEGEEQAGVVGELEVSSQVIESSHESEQINTSENKRVLATPVARALARDLGLDINSIKGTGENGRVLREDIQNYSTKNEDTSISVVSKQTFSMPSITTENVTRVPISKLRKSIVKAMVTSKSLIPHTTLMDEVNVTKLVEFRKSQKELAANEGIKLTYLPFIIKAIALTIKEFPIFNSSFDHEKEEIIYKNFMNIGIAVDTPDGLIVPNIKDTDKLSIFEIAKQVENLAKQATNRTIKLDDIQNGTFTITNYGSLDSSFGVPIIKHPEVAIIGIGKISKKPVVENDQIIIADILPISLAVDHRIIDGADAGRFSMKFKEYISNPMKLLLS